MEFYPHLPGYKHILKDGGLVFTNAVPTTNSILLMGTSVDGPICEPIRCQTLSEAERIFGTVVDSEKRYNNTTLLLAYQEAAESGCQDVRLMRVTGTQATATLVDNLATASTKVNCTMVNGGSLYNNFKIIVSSTAVAISIPRVKGGFEDTSKPDLTFNFADYTTLLEMTQAMTNNPLNLYIKFELENEDDSSDEPNTLGAGTFSFTGGEDKISNTPAQMKTALTAAYSALADYDVDIVVPLGVYADDTTNKFAQQLVNFCGEVSSRNKTTLGVIATSPLINPTLANVKTYADTLIALDNVYTLRDADDNVVYEDDGEVTDAGRYLQIVVGEGIFKNARIGNYVNSMISTYAGMISALAPQSATTNKPVLNVKKLTYNFSVSQLNAITGNKIVTFRLRPGKGIAVTDGITSAKTGSDYTRLSTLRIVAAVISNIKKITEPFIGEPGGEVSKNTLITAIQAGLDAMKNAGVLIAFKFSIEATPQETVAGIVNIVLEIVPQFELRKIRVVINLKPTL